MFLDNITNKYYPFIFVLMSIKETKNYIDIFHYIYDYITNNFDDEPINLLTFCTDF